MPSPSMASVSEPVGIMDAETAADEANKVNLTGEGGLPKHRACDECRMRKLKCTKEANGCSRCQREGIQCHYSPQKPMGRPRKRLHIEAVDEKEDEEEPSGQPPSTDVAMVDLSFIDDGVSSNFNLFELLGADLASFGSGIDPTVTTEPTQTSQTQSRHGVVANPWLNMGNPNFGGVNGDLLQPQTQDRQETSPPSQDRRYTPIHLIGPLPSAEQPGQQQLPSELTADAIPGLSPPNSNSAGSTSGSSPESSDSTNAAPPPRIPHCMFSNPAFPVACPCLARMYLALDSLQSLPGQVGPAMSTARNAARTAHDVCACTTCSPPNFTDPEYRPTVQSFQNIMMLGALLPSIANSYMRILGMIDEEAKRATAEGRQLTFSLDEYGGLWGRLGTGLCGGSDILSKRPLEPATWRVTVRALLRCDVYGLKKESNSLGCGSFRQIGLKDIIEHLEERSKRRHDNLDKLYASGELHDPESAGHVILPPGEKHNCQRIMEVARRSIDHLVIA